MEKLATYHYCESCGGVYLYNDDYEKECCGLPLKDTGYTADYQYSYIPQPDCPHFFDYIFVNFVKGNPNFNEEKYKQNLIEREERRKEYNRKHPPIKKSTQQTNTPHCPVCNSTNISPISTTKKIGALAFWGLFSVGYQQKHYKCNNCHTTF